MTVAENVSTVPKLEEWDEERIEERVDELLALMDLSPEEYREQYPGALSGGQRQRVGVARALAADPDVLLMDEPFGALDPITRETLQDEFLEIQAEINTTIIFVTHSIDEALKMGDKIAIYNVGEIVQCDTPREILQNPANEFVEDFIGADRTLKQLQVTTVSEVMDDEVPSEYAGLVDDLSPGQVAAADGGDSDADLVPVSPTDSTQVALSRIIQAGTDALPVVRDERVVGIVREAAIRQQRAGKGGA